MEDIVNRLSQATILVVDDDMLNQHIIARALAKSGFTKIRTASDGREALEKTFDLKPDLVILDLSMPNLDGFGYCEEVRNTADLPRMPIIVQTMLTDREAKLRALRCGADDFLNKPLDFDELNLRVCNQLDRYFMMSDLQNMCEYLKMEFEQVREMIEQVREHKLPAHILARLNKHCDVIETMAVLPARG